MTAARDEARRMFAEAFDRCAHFEPKEIPPAPCLTCASEVVAKLVAERDEANRVADCNRESMYTIAKQRDEMDVKVGALQARVSELEKENEALTAQFRAHGIAPYLDRMKELAARAELAEQRAEAAERRVQRGIEAARKFPHDCGGHHFCPVCQFGQQVTRALAGEGS